MLELKDIFKRFESKEVLKGATYSFEKGKIYGLLGRNGAGKTTLFNIIYDELEQDQGTITLNEKPLTEGEVALVFSTPFVPDFLTGFEYVKFLLDIQHLSSTQEDVETYLKRLDFDLSDGDRLIRDYSHGMKNKLNLINLLVMKPEVMLLDEPLTSFDVVVAKEIKDMLRELKEDHIIILSTHILELAKDLCDEVVLLHDGVLSGLSKDNFNDPDFEDKIIEILKSGENDA
ncbi:ABC transporter ATP-binding protein [Guggenheimella bovis]